LVAEGSERLEPLTAVVGGAPLAWTERRLVIRSHQLAQAGARGLQARRPKAQAAVEALPARRQGKPRLTQLPAVPAAVAAILRRYRVEGLLAVRSEERMQKRAVRRYRDRPARVQVEREVQMHTHVDQEAVATARRRLGWRVYATTQPADQRSLAQAVLAYRHAYLSERDMGRRNGRPLSLTPMYRERDDHATGLIRLLSIGLRMLTLLEFAVRRRLAADQSALAGLYAGNPKRATTHPTAERVLESFEGLTLTVIQEGRNRRHHLTPLSSLQQRILALLDLPVDIYTQLCTAFPKPP
jgi:transposase